MVLKPGHAVDRAEQVIPPGPRQRTSYQICSLRRSLRASRRGRVNSSIRRNPLAEVR
jgi:hypothetical protein